MTNKRITKLEKQVAELTADNATFLSAWYELQKDIMEEFDRDIDPYLPKTDHPGSVLLEERERDKKRLEAAENFIEQFNAHPPKSISGVVIDALAAYYKVRGTKP